MMTTRQGPRDSTCTIYNIFHQLTHLAASEENHETSSGEDLFQSFIMIDPSAYQPATLKESMAIRFANSQKMKEALGIKESSHDTDIVSFPDGSCDFIFSPDSPYEINLNELPGSGQYAYLLTKDCKLYYLTKYTKDILPIKVSTEKLLELCYMLELEPFKDGAEVRLRCLMENINVQHIQKIALYTLHGHGMGIYKKHKSESPMSAVEASNSTMYQLLALGLFPTSYAVRNENNQDIGIFSKLLPGFITNRKLPLHEKNLRIESLKDMKKNRNENEKKEILAIFEGIQTNITPSLERKIDTEKSYFSQLWEAGKLYYQYCFGGEFTAQNIKPALEEFIRQGKKIDELDFGSLESLRDLLINRKKQIKDSLDHHNHKIEWQNLDDYINKLSLILLHETAFYMQGMRKLDKQLKDNWVDIDIEMQNPNSKYANLQIEEGLASPVHVSLEDIKRFRIHCNQAIALTSRYFAMDPDGHNNNNAADGKFLDGDLAVYILTHLLVCPWRKPGIKDFELNVEDFLNFPNLRHAFFRYWVTQSSIVDRSADTICTATPLQKTKNLTKNFFRDTDIETYKKFSDSPVFSFQKYIQLMIEILMNKKIYSACAELHMTDDLSMLNEEGHVLPLVHPSCAYQLCTLSETSRERGSIYLQAKPEGLYYEVIGIDEKLHTNTLSWNDLPSLNQKNFLSNKEKTLRLILKQTEKAGHTSVDWAQDIRSLWIKYLSERAIEVKEKLALELTPLKNIMEHHSEFLWNCIQEHFEKFLENKAQEYHPDAMKLLNNAINLEDIKKDFEKLKTEILCPASFKEDNAINYDYIDPIHLELMENPMKLDCGHRLDECTLNQLLSNEKCTCPVCRAKILNPKPDSEFKKLIFAYRNSQDTRGKLSNLNLFSSYRFPSAGQTHAGDEEKNLSQGLN